MRIEIIDKDRFRVIHDRVGKAEYDVSKLFAVEPRLLDFVGTKLKPEELGPQLRGLCGQSREWRDYEKAVAAAGKLPKGRQQELWAAEQIEKWNEAHPELQSLYSWGLPDALTAYFTRKSDGS